MTVVINGTTGITDVNGTAAAPAITGTDTDSGVYFSTNTVAISTNGTAAVTVDSSQNTGFGTASPSYKVDVNGSFRGGGAVISSNVLSGLLALPETTTITAAAPSATTNFDVSSQPIQYYTSNASTNFTLNIRASSGATFSSICSVGQSYTIVLMVTNGGTAYYPTSYTIDGAAATVKWQGGTAPTGGNASALDVYSITITKTAATPTYLVLASQTKFA